NVPIGIAVLAAAARWLTESRATSGRRLDLPGAVLVTAGLAVLAYGIAETEAQGWDAPGTLVALAVAILLILGFLLVEARSRAPLMPLKLFRVRSVSAANAVMIISGAAMMGMWFFMTLYAQNVLGYSPLLAGLALIPSSLAVVSGAKIAPVLMRSLGARPVVLLGTAVAAAGFGWQSTMRADGTFLGDILGPGIVMMAGAGLAGTPLASLAVSGADPRDAGLVSGLINTSRTMGGALGLAILSTVAASATAGADAPAALTDGYALAFRTAAVMLAGAFLLGLLWLPRE
ncbi:MFS transporter, partial [Streptomyces sp. ZG43]